MGVKRAGGQSVGLWAAVALVAWLLWSRRGDQEVWTERQPAGFTL